MANNDKKGRNMAEEWQENLFEVAHGEAWYGDSGIADWLNELESDEGLEIEDLFLVHLGQPRTQPQKELVLAVARVSIG